MNSYLITIMQAMSEILTLLKYKNINSNIFL